MHWKIKAAIQNAVALLPEEMSYELYYQIQRHFGGWRRPSPVKRLIAGIQTWKRLLKHGYAPEGKTFFEVGTGRVPVVPLAYWLMGARKTVTIDLNPYFKPEQLEAAIGYMAAHQGQVQTLFGPLLDGTRFQHLIEAGPALWRDPARVFAECGIEYLAPGDAADTKLPDNEVDFHTSYTVFEHIPPAILRNILVEGNRITRADGGFVHRIDYSDHFSHSDRAISAVNFLHYGEKEWARLAGNRYMYMNRLRHDDYEQLFASVDHLVLEKDADRDDRIRSLLESGSLRLHEDYVARPVSILEITGAWFLTKLRQEASHDQKAASLPLTS